MVEKAENGELVDLGEYQLRDGGRQTTVAIPQIIQQNVEAEPGDGVDCYGDFQSGFLVIDLNSGGE